MSSKIWADKFEENNLSRVHSWDGAWEFKQFDFADINCIPPMSAMSELLLETAGDVVPRAPWESEAEAICSVLNPWKGEGVDFPGNTVRHKFSNLGEGAKKQFPLAHLTPTFPFFSRGWPAHDIKTLCKQFTKLSYYSEVWYWLYNMHYIHFEYLLWGTLCTKSLIWFNPPKSSVRQEILLSSFLEMKCLKNMGLGDWVVKQLIQDHPVNEW